MWFQEGIRLPKDSEWEERINPVLPEKINGIEWKAILGEYGLGG